MVWYLFVVVVVVCAWGPPLLSARRPTKPPPPPYQTKHRPNQLTKQGVPVEAELGRLAGKEDGLSVAEKEAKMTDPAQVTK